MLKNIIFMRQTIRNFGIINCLLIIFFISSCRQSIAQTKPTVCILGGTPSTVSILNDIPDSLKTRYNFISFNRPGYGGTKNAQLNEEILFDLAKKAGLKENDYGIIGISGGGPLALLIASKFKLKHCGIVSGMVSKKPFFQFGDSAVTKDVMASVLEGYGQFEQAILKFPNVDEIVKMAGNNSRKAAIRACYDDLYFILNKDLNSAIHDKSFVIDWYHGEKDVNVPLKSAQLFLKDYQNANLTVIPKATHGIDSRVYIRKLLDSWEFRAAK
jgi:pimeloyl-ACP methyl ester carboxylesterase